MYLDQTEVKFGLSYYYYYFNYFQGHETSVISQFSFFGAIDDNNIELEQPTFLFSLTTPGLNHLRLVVMWTRLTTAAVSKQIVKLSPVCHVHQFG